MPSWGGILQEIEEAKKKSPAALDLVRRKYIIKQHTHSKRAVILYASKWTQPSDNVPPNMVSVSEDDVQGLMEVIHNVKEKDLDLIIHSPGGSIAAADAFVQYLRSKFEHIRVFVPYAAMSAGTMIACAADEIVMGKHSFLGPIDPQLIMQTSLGIRSIPAQAIIDQFESAKAECKDPAKLAVWLPMLQQYGPDLLQQCQNVLALSETLVQKSLETYMFKGDPERVSKSKGIAEWLAKHSEFLIHARHLSRDVLRANGLVNISNLEDDDTQQDLILSIFHATTHTFAQTGAVKIIENHLGSAYINQVQQVMIKQPQPASAPKFVPPSPGQPSQPPFPKKPSMF